jgi:UDP-N-acetylmuramoyl-tripeptide--D-alanyl-D-alanine ligase
MRMASRLSKVITYPKMGDFYHCDLSKNDFYLEVTTEKKELIHTRLTGAYNLDNIATALCIGKYFEVPSELANEAIAAYIPQNMRSQVIEKGTNKIILDAYNANPSSMEVAIANLGNIKADKKIAILGDMFELGDLSVQEHNRISDLAVNNHFHLVILIGKAFGTTLVSDTNCLKFDSISEAKDWLILQSFDDAVFLLKGSRGMALEQLVEHINP